MIFAGFILLVGALIVTALTQRKEGGLSGPLKGMAISVCLFVVAVLVGLTTWCGHGSGSSGDSPAGTAALWFLFATMGSFLGCLLWLLINAVRNAMRD